MIEEKMLALLKEEIQQTVHSISLDSLTGQMDLLKKQLTLLENIEDMYTFKQKNKLYKEEPENDSEKVNEPQSEQQQVSSEVDLITDIKEEMYVFERKLKGGFLPLINAYVPETVVRHLGLEDGDFVYATPKYTNNPNMNYYNYSIAKKREGELVTNRVQYNLCPVKKEAGHLIVDESLAIGEPIRYNEGIFTVVINDDDVYDLKIKEGDLVDIAFPEDSPQKAKVIWKHAADTLERDSSLSTNKSKKVDKSSKKDTSHTEQTLFGKTILVVGNEGMKSIYRNTVEVKGGTFLWADSSFGAQRLEPMVRKADVCVFLLSVSGHIGMNQIKQMCKEYNVPFKTSWSNGISSVIRIAELV